MLPFTLPVPALSHVYVCSPTPARWEEHHHLTSSPGTPPSPEPVPEDQPASLPPQRGEEIEVPFYSHLLDAVISLKIIVSAN